LTAVGFNVERAHDYEELVSAENDAVLLRWARSRKRILVGHDRFRAPQGLIRQNFYPELADRGGRVLVVSKSAIGDPLRFVGIVLATYQQWRSKFEEIKHGIVRINPNGLGKVMERADCLERTKGLVQVCATPHLREQLRGRATLPARHRKPRKIPGQGEL